VTSILWVKPILPNVLILI